jgi:phage antirepressor YoqD-like protein
MIEIETEGLHHEIFYTVSETAKLLDLKIKEGKHVKHLGRNLFFKVLRQNKVLSKKDNSPNQSFINLGLAKLHSTSKRYKRYTLPVFSENGVQYLKERFENHKYITYYEKTIRNKFVKSLDEVC